MAARSGTPPLRSARSEDVICSKCLSKSVQDVRQGVRRVAEGSRAPRVHRKDLVLAVPR